MGSIKKQRKKYQKPFHPWQKTRIDSEKKYMVEYGLKNKTELWKISSKLTKYKDQVKRLTALRTKQSGIERKHLIDKLILLGLLKPGEELEQILGFDTKNLLDRRLQTILVKKGLSRTANQARQFITHRHVTVNGKLMTSPNYLVTVQEEDQISFATASTLYDQEHPERVVVVKKKKGKGEPKETLPDLKEVRILTEEEKEAKEIEHVLGTEEEREIIKLEQETPEKEVKEIITKGKTEMEKLKK
jgi:small subunit ribosomal protein S4